MMLKVVSTSIVFGLIGFLGSVPAAMAQERPYALVPGDTLEVVYQGSEASLQAMVDVDGNIRLPGLRGVTVARNSLDEAETLLETALKEGGLYVNPSVSLSILSYAPVIVVGDVSNPGRYQFFPGMTVSAAMGLAGGSALEGGDELEFARLETGARSRLKQASNDVAAAVVQIATLDAFINNQREVVLDEVQRETVPAPARSQLPELLAAETEILHARLERRDKMMQMWSSEIAQMEDRTQLSDDRLELQHQLADTLQAEVDASRLLVERGLQTTNRLSDLVVRDTTARATVLELENARILLDQSIADANRERFSFFSAERQMVLDEKRRLRAALDRALLDYGRELETITTLIAMAPSVLKRDNLATKFERLSPRVGGGARQVVSEETLLFPGDALLITLTLDDSGF